MTGQHHLSTAQTCGAVFSQQDGEPQTIGAGFNALSFRHNQFEGLMDPLVMVDHFTMTEPTFGAHAHAGISAVSLLFEDSRGTFRNRDSLGNDIELAPGDLFWLKAARGAVHDEAPTPGSATHALQVFVNLPARLKQDAPASLHVPAERMPVIVEEGCRARLMMGRSHGVRGAASPALPMTILDVSLEAGGHFEHRPEDGAAAWIHAVSGAIEILIDGRKSFVRKREAVAAHGAREISLSAAARSQAVILSGQPVREPFVQKGPFVMSTSEELEATISAAAAGKFGSIE
ncbi:MAG: pirin family protein [Neomegalonema sp.]|nr:pirin family protein [Neomegalonema sp.]